MSLSILWISNSPSVGSGYGVETALVTKRIRDAGHNIAIICNYGINGAKASWEGIPLIPRSDNDVTCRDIIEHYVDEYKADIVITHWDVPPYPDDFGYAAKRWVPWLPVDRHPLSIVIGRRLKSAYWILPWCNDARDTIKEAGYENQTIVPLCIDTKNYQILDGLIDEEGNVITHAGMKKKFYGDENVFVVGMVAMNMDTRKNTHRVMRAINLLKDKIPGLRFSFHGLLKSAGGVNIKHILKQQDIAEISSITPEVRYTIGLTPAEMCALYNSFDVIALPSAGEGCGIPTIEGNACGNPAIFTNFTAQPEYSYGMAIEPVAMNLCVEDGSYQAVVRDEDIADAIYDMWKIYSTNPDEWQAMRLAARANALNFDADKIFADYWVPTLKMLEDKIAGESEIDKWLV